MTENGRGHGSGGDGADLDVQVRREIRGKYRELIAKANREREELIRPDTDGLGQLIGEVDELFGQVTKLHNKAPTSEAVLDAQLLKTASALGYQKAKKLHVDNKFDPNVFTQKLITFMHGRRLEGEEEVDEEGWEGLGRATAPVFHNATGFTFMLGAFEREPMKRRQHAQKKADEPTGPVVVPVKVKSMAKSHQEVTTEEVERMVGILRELTENEDGDPEPISYFEFVINPDSFSQTVENIFHLSFVLKDGHAKIFMDGDGLPVIVPAKPHNEEQSGKSVAKKQVLVSIDMDQWEELIEAFNITEPLIPTREQTNEEQNGHT